MFWDTKQVSSNTKRLKLSHAYSQTTRSEIGTQPQGKIWKKLKHLETKKHPLKNDLINQENKNQFKKFMEANENENTMVQNLWDTAKAVLRGK